MHTVVDKVVPDETRETKPFLNETQRVLGEALRRLDEGARWCQGHACIDNAAFCAVGALYKAVGRNPYDAETDPERKGPAELRYLNEAARELGATYAGTLNDRAKDFSEVRTMFEKAITLAGQS